MRVPPLRAVVTRLGLGLTTAAALGVATLATAALGPATAALASAPGPASAAAAAVQPATATPGGSVRFTVSCASLDTAAATLLGQPLSIPALIPMDAAAMQGDFVITVRLPSGIRPGRYHPRIECSDGTSAVATLSVESVQAAVAARAAAASERAAAAAPTSPARAGLAAGGVALMAVGALAGGSALALRRRVRAHPLRPAAGATCPAGPAGRCRTALHLTVRWSVVASAMIILPRVQGHAPFVGSS